MKSLIASTVCIALVSLATQPVWAQDQAVSLQHHGVDGVWLPLDMSRQLQADAEVELPEARLQIRLMTDQLQLAHDRHENVAQALALSMEAERRAVGELERAVRLRVQAEDERDSFWRAPVFWAVVGGAVMLTIQVVAVWAFNQLVTP